MPPPITINILQLWQIVLALSRDLDNNPGEGREELHTLLASFHWETRDQHVTHFMIVPIQQEKEENE